MFQSASLVLLDKTDLLGVVPFDEEWLRERVARTTEVAS